CSDTPSPNLRIPNKSQVPKTKKRHQNLELGIWELEYGTWNFESSSALGSRGGLVFSRRFSSNPSFLLKQPLVNASRVEAPARGQERHFVHVRGDDIQFGKGIAVGWLRVIEAFHAKCLLGRGPGSL